MSNFSQGNGFNDILKRMLDKIPDTLDKRQGSIIYDALAPAAAELAQAYISLDVYADQTYLSTAVGENLDNRVADYGLIRNAATPAYRIGQFINSNEEPMEINLDTRWAAPVNYGGYIYKVTERLETGKYILECETLGTEGNEYFGDLLPLSVINNLGSAVLTDIYIAGENTETDDSLRTRTLNKLRETPFGGNIAEYRQYVESLEGIVACLVVPVWNGGGTVKIIPITSSYEIPTEAKIQEIQEILDPTQTQGTGLGIAPIGHVVTVVAPTPKDINIEATIELESGYVLDSLQPDIESAIHDYIQETQKQWVHSNVITIYISRLIAAILTVDGVVNVSNLTINGESNNLTIYPMADNNEYPILNEVILNEN